MSVATVFFVVVMITVNGDFRHKAPVSDMATCKEMVDNSKSTVSNGGDNESSVVVFCTTADPATGWNRRLWSGASYD